MKRSRAYYLRLALGGFAVAVGLLWLLPSPIDPLAFDPPEAPALLGPLLPNDALSKAIILAPEEVWGPEDVEVDAQGRIFAGTADGEIARLTLDILDRPTVETFANTGGRPLGLAFDSNGHLLVADGHRGLLRLDPSGTMEVLSAGADDKPFGFTNDIDIARDGKVYFSDASSKFGVEEYLYDLLEARPHGRFLVFDPATQTTTTLLDDLFFANGVALSKNEDFVLINETYRYRIRRYWLKGPKAGSSDIYLDNLPGFPDGISSNRQGRFWVALFTVRNPMMDFLHPHPWAKQLLSKLPKALWPKPKPYGLVLALDEKGNIEYSLQDPTGDRVQLVTSVQQAGDSLFLGNLDGQGITRFELPEAERPETEVKNPEPRADRSESTGPAQGTPSQDD
ncbi:MAG: SMP-30/gluconolactonase/LRE family protein [Deltaproteobacteria bacterium]|nr:SMP-30/gluconolactonase/LRE family protein [Deltaproteobacteria bacterium]